MNYHRGTRNPRRNQKYMTYKATAKVQRLKGGQLQDTSVGQSQLGKPPGKNWCGKGLTEQVCVLASSL